MHKITKYLILSVPFIFFFKINSFSQNNTLNFKQIDSTVTQDSLNPGEHFFYEGYKLPSTKNEEKEIRKARRNTLTTEEYIIISRVSHNKTITFIQKLKYPFLKRKKKNYDRIMSKKSNPKLSTSVPNSPRYSLSIKEKELLKKGDSTQLTSEEAKMYKKAKRKQKRIERYQEKHKITKLEEEDQIIVNKGKKNKKLLTKEERKKFRKLRPIDKKNERIKEQKKQFKIDSALAAVAWLPIEPKKHPLKTFWNNLKNPGQRPSSYVKKIRRIESRYKLTPKEMKAWNMFKSNVQTTGNTKRLAYRAYYKLSKKYEKEKKIKHKEFLKSQPRQTRKSIKKKTKGTNKRVKKFYNH